jgi:hypothetical protein
MQLQKCKFAMIIVDSVRPLLLESAALANKANFKLVRAGAIRCESRAHFLALC